MSPTDPKLLTPRPPPALRMKTSSAAMASVPGRRPAAPAPAVVAPPPTRPQSTAAFLGVD